jgi:hypothetical protein
MTSFRLRTVNVFHPLLMVFLKMRGFDITWEHVKNADYQRDDNSFVQCIHTVYGTYGESFRNHLGY